MATVVRVGSRCCCSRSASRACDTGLEIMHTTDERAAATALEVSLDLIESADRGRSAAG